MNFHNKQECLFLASLSSLVQFLLVSLEPTRKKHLSFAQLQCRLGSYQQTSDKAGKAWQGQTL
jgi:hypothetical protein